MHQKNNNNGAVQSELRNTDQLQDRDPYLARVAGNTAASRRRGYSEAMHAVMDELETTATSRRAVLYNALRH